MLTKYQSTWCTGSIDGNWITNGFSLMEVEPCLKHADWGRMIDLGQGVKSCRC